jgi:uncharacterized protein with HEPN domain
MIDAAEQAQELTRGVSAGDLEADRQRRDAPLWNFTVLGEAAGQLSDDVKTRFPGLMWQQPVRLRNRIVHGYWSLDLEILHTAAARAGKAQVRHSGAGGARTHDRRIMSRAATVRTRPPAP